MEKRATTLEKIEYNQNLASGSSSSSSKTQTSLQRSLPNHSAFISASIPGESLCPKCGLSHSLSECSKLLELCERERFNEIKRLRICILCLKAKHRSIYCKGPRCKICKGRHNTLLHFPVNRPNSAEASDSKTSNSSETSQQIFSACSNTIFEPAILASVIVKITNFDGEKIPCRAILDSGATTHIITEDFVKKCGFNMNSNICGIGGNATLAKWSCNFILHSRNNQISFNIRADILPKITNNHPSRHLDIKSWNMPDVELADPSFAQPGPIDLLIGAGLFWEILLPGRIRLGDSLPILQETRLGWIVAGSDKSSVMAGNFAFVSVKDSDVELNELVKRFWEVDSVAHENQYEDPNNVHCDQYFQSSTIRDDEGRFHVRLPFAKSHSLLGQSLETAYRRFLGLEKRLQKNPVAKKMYDEFIKEYADLQHLELCDDFDSAKPHYFMPHHCVMKLSSSSTKLRVVFDASCKTSSGYSLNDLLHCGPKLQDDLFVILLRFRLHQFVLTGDIQKMYRQVRVQAPDSNFQLILWRFQSDAPIQIYRLCTVTYGTAPGAYLTIKTLQALSECEGDKFPMAAAVLRKNFYVDDMMVGAKSLEELSNIHKEITALLASGGFVLSKFCSNSSDMLSKIDPDHREKFLTIDDKDVVKTLGLIWQPKEDDLRFSYQPKPYSPNITKRVVLAEIASLFDPLGLICPVVTLAKMFYQSLWKLKIDWDETLNANLVEKWQKFRQGLENLKLICIPRYVLTSPNYDQVELHGFSDASQGAYGACIYLRAVHCNGNITSRILCAKSKVAPSKPISIARLELLGAKLLVDLVQRVKKEVLCELEISREFLWTDSRIVLCWLSAEPHLWKIFVAHRVAKIQEGSSISSWRHVPGDQNPADLLSRGLMPFEMIKNKMWFTGAEFLNGDDSIWPEPFVPRQNKEVIEEMRAQQYVFITNATDDLTSSMFFSVSYRGIIRSWAYAIRFVVNCQTKLVSKTKRITYLRDITKLYERVPKPTAKEAEDAEYMFIRNIQKASFDKEYTTLVQNQSIPKNSSLKNLAPFVDDHGIMRVGGRLGNSSVPYRAKHQILLPKNHSYTHSLIFFTHHFRTFHSGPHTVLTVVREKYWPVSGLMKVRSVLHSCVWCFRMRPKIVQQIMGDLPFDRVNMTAIRPFSTSGVDLAGPIVVRHHARCRVEKKVYAALFICLITKAVHIELVVDLSTKAFVRALKRFVADRGGVVKIWSDNGSNFKGASNQLREVNRMIRSSSDQIKEACNELNFEWEFIPPRSPNFGGLWEASIKIAKRLMKNVVGNAEITVDELHTVLRQAAAIINSRPITPVSSDPNDLEPLTPGHLLYGGPAVSLPEVAVPDGNVNLVTLHQRMMWCKQQFCKRFKEEYIQSLQPRTKWFLKNKNVSVGTMVILKDDNLPSYQWSVGRIIEVKPDKNGNVRVVRVKTSSGEYDRSISNIAVLPIEDNH